MTQVTTMQRSQSDGGSRGSGCRILAAGFGATTLMWLLSYLAILIPGPIVGEFLFGLAVLSLVGGGLVAGRSDRGLGQTTARPGSGLLQGLFVGLVSAILNLLVVVSLLKSEMAGGMGWIVGILVGCLIAGGIGGLLGGSMKPWQTNGNWLTIFCWVAAGLTFFMIVTGGVVTGFEAGLAVPDWPNSYGHNMLLYPLSEMVADPESGVFFEHAHRLTGMFVGLTAIVLCITLWIADMRMWVGMLGLVVLVLVIMQGVLGGLRVTGVLTMSQDAADLSPSTMLAIVHGVLAQVLLAIMAVVAAVTSTRWLRGKVSIGSGQLAVDRQFTIVLLVCLLIQLGLGAAYRHLGTDLGTSAPAANHALLGHIVMAVVVAIMGMFVGLRASSMEGRDSVFVWLGRTLLISIGAQIVLGIAAVAAVMMRPEAGTTADVPGWEVLLTSAHQANGALLLALSLLLVAWYRHAFEPPSEVPA